MAIHNPRLCAGEQFFQMPSRFAPLQPKRRLDFLRADDFARESDLVGDDERLEKAMKAVSTKAPIALRIAASLIDEGFRVPLDEGLKMELAHLHEIFSTRDALTGLLSIGKSKPVFEGA